MNDMLDIRLMLMDKDDPLTQEECEFLAQYFQAIDRWMTLKGVEVNHD